ncbi:MAG TPA: class I SAM-dependent methyltransferase [Actinotalea sp.]|nr:class I SAM-dependent methyltransferase [Actinotalea sp.]
MSGPAGPTDAAAGSAAEGRDTAGGVGPMDAAAWDARYAAASPWGSAPNVFVVRHTEHLTPGRARDVAAGDGRHALWLAGRGWQVEALDFSAVAIERGRAAAERLAADGSLTGSVRWRVADATTVEPEPSSADLVVMAYLHLPAEAARQALVRAAATLAPGGTFVVVGHDRSNLAGGVGGPRSIEVLTDPQTVADALTDAGLDVQVCEVAPRPVDGADRPALDTLVVAVRPAG